MAGEWRDVALEDVADDLTVGYVGPMASEYVDDGIPFLRSLNVEPLRINKNDLKFITPEFHRRLQKSRLAPGDVVIVRTGKPGACSVVPDWLADANCSDLVVVRCGKQLNNRFLAYYINTVASSHVNAHLVGAVQQHFNVGSARTMRINLPPLAEQKAIVAVLGALDDKIELNRRMNATLEAMARALFQSWFVDIDLIRASASELIAEGVLEIGDGYRAKNSELHAEGLPFVRAGDLDSGFDLDGAERLSFESVKKAPTKLSHPGDVAFTSKGTVGRIARVDASLPQFVYAPQVCFWRSRSHESLHPAILYCWMMSGDFRSQIMSRSGQTDMAPYISLKDQRELSVPRFPKSQADVGSQIQTFLDRHASNRNESRVLTSLRDMLLPKLLSGEISASAI